MFRKAPIKISIKVLNEMSGNLKNSRNAGISINVPIIWLQISVLITLVFLAAIAARKSATPQPSIAIIPNNIPREIAMNKDFCLDIKRLFNAS